MPSGHAPENVVPNLEQGSQVCHSLSLLFSTSADTNCAMSASLNDYTSLPRRMDRLQNGLKEVEKFLSKLELALLLFPISSLDSLLESNKGANITDHSTAEYEMDVS